MFLFVARSYTFVHMAICYRCVFIPLYLSRESVCVQMAPVHWRDAERLQLHQFSVNIERPLASSVGAGRTPSTAPRGIQAAALPGTAAAFGAGLYGSGAAGLESPPQVTRIFQQSFNRENLLYEVIAKGGAARDAEIIKCVSCVLHLFFFLYLDSSRHVFFPTRSCCRRYVTAHQRESGIVYCLSKRDCEELATKLNKAIVTANRRPIATW